jgi:pimeloyl-ACP methyl ester carboxylesterase
VIAGPYVLVGHSLGNMLVRYYQIRYPADVVGMVLVDSFSRREPAVCRPPKGALPELTVQHSQSFIVACGRPEYAFMGTQESASVGAKRGSNFQFDPGRLHNARLVGPCPLGNISLVVLTATQFAVTQAPGITTE